MYKSIKIQDSRLFMNSIKIRILVENFNIESGDGVKLRVLLCPYMYRSRANSFWPVCPSVCPFVCPQKI